MQRVDIQLLGPVLVRVDGRPAPLRNRGDLLLARLVLDADRPVSREALATWAWPGSERAAALHSLREALFKLRAALGDDLAGEPLLLVERATVTFRPNAGLSCDVLDVRLRRVPATVPAARSGPRHVVRTARSLRSLGVRRSPRIGTPGRPRRAGPG